MIIVKTHKVVKIYIYITNNCYFHYYFMMIIKLKLTVNMIWDLTNNLPTIIII